MSQPIAPIDRGAGFNADCPLFRKLGREDLQHLAAMARLRVLTERQNLCLQNSPSGRLFNIASGAAMVERISSAGRRQILGFVFPGDFVGLSNSSHFEYGIKCLNDVSAYEIPRQKLYALAEKSARLKENLSSIRDLIQAMTFDQIFLLGQKRAHERLCFFLLQMLDRLPGARPEHIQLPMGRQDIADYLGLTTETVSRSLAKLKREGILSLPVSQAIVIKDMAAVRELADIS